MAIGTVEGAYGHQSDEALAAPSPSRRAICEGAEAERYLCRAGLTSGLVASLCSTGRFCDSFISIPMRPSIVCAW